MGIRSFHGWGFFESSRVYSLQEQRETVGVGVRIMQLQVDAQSKWQVQGDRKGKEQGLLIVLGSYDSLAPTICQELF